MTKHRCHGLPWIKAWDRSFKALRPLNSEAFPFAVEKSLLFIVFQPSKSALLPANCWEENHPIKQSQEG